MSQDNLSSRVGCVLFGGMDPNSVILAVEHILKHLASESQDTFLLKKTMQKKSVIQAHPMGKLLMKVQHHKFNMLWFKKIHCPKI